jgi:hypothetical protein
MCFPFKRLASSHVPNYPAKLLLTSCLGSWNSVILLPIAVTFYITWWFIRFFDGFFSPIYESLGIHVIGNIPSGFCFAPVLKLAVSSWRCVCVCMCACACAIERERETDRERSLIRSDLLLLQGLGLWLHLYSYFWWEYSCRRGLEHLCYRWASGSLSACHSWSTSTQLPSRSVLLSLQVQLASAFETSLWFVFPCLGMFSYSRLESVTISEWHIESGPYIWKKWNYRLSSIGQSSSMGFSTYLRTSSVFLRIFEIP